jgi:hypothetical protein
MYLFFDCEMGGIGREYSLLTAYFIVVDQNFQKVDELYLYTKPDDGIYRVCGRAMEVNQINLSEHDKIAVPYKEAGSILYQFLSKNSDKGKIKLIPCGHGIRGDIDVIVEHIISRNTFENFTSYRAMCTSAVAQFLLTCKLLPSTVSGSLESLGKYFGIIKDEVPALGGPHSTSFCGLLDVVTKLHDAKTDTLVTVAVLQKMKESLSRACLIQELK